MDGRGGDAFFPAMSAIGRGEEPNPLTCIEDITVKEPDKTGWESYCGKYEPDPDDDYIDEIFMKDGELYAKVVTDMRYRYETKLYPLEGNTFGIKEYDVEIAFSDGCMSCDGETVRKHSAAHN